MLRHLYRLLTGSLLAMALGGCASFGLGEPPSVVVAGIEPIAGQGLETRFELRLRIQNPNDSPIDYDGLWVELSVDGSRLASGVSDQRGTVPRFGETVLAVPVSVSLGALVRQALAMAGGDRPGTRYAMRGKLSRPGLGSTRFESDGELKLPISLERLLQEPAR